MRWPRGRARRQYIRRSQLIGPHALPHLRLRHLLRHRLHGELAHQSVPGGVEAVPARIELRVLRLGRLELLPAARGDHRHRLRRRCGRLGRARRTSPAAGHGALLRRVTGPARVVQVLRLRLGQRRQPHPCHGTRTRHPPLSGGAPHRHLVLHVHGVELCDRHLPSATAAGPPARPRPVPRLLPPPLGGADRPGQRAPAPIPPQARSAGRRLLARVVARSWPVSSRRS